LQGGSEVIEMTRFVGVNIWGETCDLLLSRDRFVNIGKVTKTLKATKGGDSEVVETYNLLGVVNWG
jgi:hypothetical protein